MLLILKQCEDKCTVGNMWHVENGTITSTITNLSSETNVFSDIINSDTKGTTLCLNQTKKQGSDCSNAEYQC